MKSSAAALRQELSLRNLRLAESVSHECTYGCVPSVLYQEAHGGHGNFLSASYRRICASPDWRRRLKKCYAASALLPRNLGRVRRELDCANSSDALLMNIFCYPGVTSRRALCALLGIEPGLRPRFGVKPHIPFVNGRADRTEVDMALGNLFVEAKLTEADFQTARPDLVLRYADLDGIFDVGELPSRAGKFCSYQLVRGILAAHYCGMAFAVIYDRRRADLAEDCFAVARALRRSERMSRLAILTWQELSATLPKTLQKFLAEKYGIYPAR